MQLALARADGAGKALSAGTRELARLLLSPAAESGGRDPLPADVGKLADSFAPGRSYWAGLEAPFRAFLLQLAREYGTTRRIRSRRRPV